MRLYKFDSRVVLRVKPGAAEFIKNFTSNIPMAPRNAFLDRQGKIVAVFDQKAVSADEILVVIEKRFCGRLYRHLEPFLRFSETTLEESALGVYFDLDGDFNPPADAFTIPQKKGKIILTGQSPAFNISLEIFTLFRVQNGIPVQGMDFDEEMLLNVSDHEFVSYTKGCYLGQEIIARVHHRSKPSKKLVVKAESECSPDEIKRMTSRVPDPDTGRIMGFVFTAT